MLRINKNVQEKTKLMYLIPHFTGFLVLFIIPFVIGLNYSMRTSLANGRFVGLKNYFKIINNVAFRIAFKNNVQFMFIAIPLVIGLAFVIAYAIYEVKASEFIKFAFIIPIAIPSATVIGFFRKLFSVGGWDLLDSDYAMVAVLIIFVWRNIGYALIILSAGLNSIPKVYLENAQMDGANIMQRVKNIIIPMLTPSLIFATIVTFINSYDVFKDIYLLQGRYPNPSIYMIQNYMNNKVSSFKMIDLIVTSYLFTAFIGLLILGFILIDRLYFKKVRGIE